MNTRIFKGLLTAALFGIALGFFGMLYEGIVLIPKMLSSDAERLLFWRDFYAIINPMFYYIPLVPLATLLLIVLYFKSGWNLKTKRLLGIAALCQVIALGLTFYIVIELDLKQAFSATDATAMLISAKARLANLISPTRLAFAAIAVGAAFLACQNSARTT